LRYLLTEGADPNIADKKGVTPLALASQLGWVDGVAILASKGARPDVASDTGETPLIAAVHKRDSAMVRMLLAAGADADRSDNSGRTARDYAKLDGAGNLVLEAIETYDKAKKTKKPAQTYGPSF
jgi:ankyrin repeat protein